MEFINFIFQMSTKVKTITEFSLDVQKNIENENTTPKTHPGILRILPPEVPEDLFKAIRFITRGDCQN